MIKNFEINKIYNDEFGRVDAVLAINKPVGMKSHDLVDEFRRKFSTKKVGHSGALDPFASGLMFILIGKGTKMSDSFLGLDKEYQADILFGISTESGDPEGKIMEVKSGTSPSSEVHKDDTLSKETVQKALESFLPEYEQYVPVFSSVKVNGEKLRKLARQYSGFNLISENGEIIIKFYNEPDKILKEVKLPHKKVKIYEIELLDLYNLDASKVSEILTSQLSFSQEKETQIKSDSSLDESSDELDSTLKKIEQIGAFKVARIKVKVSKGTYIRQLAIDIGQRLNIPSMLIGLNRTQIGEYKLDNVFKQD